MAPARAEGPSPHLTVRVPRPVVPLLAVGALALVAAAMAQSGQSRALEAENARLVEENRALTARADELTRSVARQALDLRALEGQLDQVRFQVDAVELQLDGIDLIGRELREAIDGQAAVGDPTGGTGGAFDATEPLSNRLDVARARLAADLALLVALRDRVAPPPPAAAAPAARADAGASASRLPAAPRSGPALDAPPANWPARGVVTSDFGWRRFRGRANFHAGIDVALPYGSQVMATGAGTVVGSGWQPGFGWSVLVQHAAGYNTLYAHLSRTAVAVGDRVAPGMLIGLSGSSGNSTGPHLHYEIWKDGRVLDPRPLMDGRAGTAGGPS